ncbi:MAG: 16S rRNA (guanine(527)-N(7))-methyltransferase RsmG [Sporolactobacillus sp.]
MESFSGQLQQHGLLLTEVQNRQFEQYFTFLIEANKKMNLTAIKEREAVFMKHFYDSLTPSFYADFSGGQSLCDVGSGAGFPGIPLKIVFPNLKLTIVDSLRKRIDFLQELTERLALQDVSLYHDRAETFAKRDEMREQFQWVTARAVAPLPVLSEYCLPLVRIGGTFVAMKGRPDEAEFDRGRAAIAQLGGKLSQTITFDLPELSGERTLLFVEKVKKTSKAYPRRAGIPARDPLK